MDIKKFIKEAELAIDALTNDKKATIASVRAYWISYVVNEEPALAIPKKYRTKAQIIAELKNIIVWLNGFGRVDKYATPETAVFAHEAALAEDFARLVDAQRAAGLPVDEEGNDLREWCGNDIEAAHAEALALNNDGDDTPPPAAAAPAPLRIEQESSDKEFKKAGIFAKDNVHCFTDCGYDCKESVRLDLILHYTQVAEHNGLAAEGWYLRVWHNGGWHACFVHEATGFMLQDHLVEGGIHRVHLDRMTDVKRRFACYNYDTPDGTAQIWVYAATAWQAIGAAIREAQRRCVAYQGIVGRLAPKTCEHARAADLYGATPANRYEVKA